jgi:hypothetical protein
MGSALGGLAASAFFFSDGALVIFDFSSISLMRLL